MRNIGTTVLTIFAFCILNGPLLSKAQNSTTGNSSEPLMYYKLREGDIGNYTIKLWPRHQVAYEINQTDFSNRGIKIIKSKIDEWNDSVKNFKFVPRTMENDYLYIFSGHGCYSYIGRVGGEQYLSLESKICLRSGTILHGMGLTAGLINQQERPDRDQYIKVNFENIPDEWQSQFEKIADKVYFHTHPYDYGSITHYPMTSSVYTDAFEVRQSLVEDNKIGKAKHLSQIDIDKLNSMYNKTIMD